MPNCDYQSFSGIFQIFLRQITNCAVPLFIAISGYFLGAKSFEEPGSALAFWKKQIPKIYIPMIVWSMAFFLSAKNIYPQNLKLIMLFCGGYNIYYFIALMVQCYFLLPLFKKITIKHVAIAYIISLLCVAFITWYIGIKGYKMYGIIELGPVPILGCYFLIGIYIRRHDRNYSLTIPIIGIIAGLILEMTEAHYLYGLHGWGQGMKVTGFIFSPFAIWFLFSKKMEDSYNEQKFFLLKMIRYLGDISFGVYLAHIYLLIFVKRIGLENIGWLPKWGLVLLLTCIMIYVMKRIAPKFSKKVLGFW